MVFFGRRRKGEERKTTSHTPSKTTTTLTTTSFSLSKEATSEHSKRQSARFLVAPRPAQPISETDLEEFKREEKEGKEARVAQVVGNALIVLSFVVNWFRKRRRRETKKKKKDEPSSGPTVEEN
jgi:hypothetical protein